MAESFVKVIGTCANTTGSRRGDSKRRTHKCDLAVGGGAGKAPLLGGGRDLMARGADHRLFRRQS
jgi:hypothetical protein